MPARSYRMPQFHIIYLMPILLAFFFPLVVSVRFHILSIYSLLNLDIGYIDEQLIEADILNNLDFKNWSIKIDLLDLRTLALTLELRSKLLQNPFRRERLKTRKKT